MALELEGFRWVNDDGSESASTFAAAQDTNFSLPLDTPKRLRCIVNSVTTSPATSKYRLEYKEAAEAVWTEVKVGGGGKITLAASSFIAASGENTTARLTAPAGKSSGADFVAGRIWDDESGLDDVALANGKYTEDEFCLQAVSANGAVVSDVYSFRMVYLTSGGVPITLNALTTAGNATDCEQGSQVTTITLTGITVAAGSNRGLVVELTWGTISVDIPGLTVTALVGGTPTAMTQKILRVTGTKATALYYIANPDTGVQSIVAAWSSYTLDTYLSATCFNNVGSVVDADTQGADAATLTMTSGPNDVTVTAITTNSSDPVSSQTLSYANSPLNPGGAADRAFGGTSNVHTYTNIGTEQVMVGIHLAAA